jgi:hypothetical protein
LLYAHAQPSNIKEQVSAKRPGKIKTQIVCGGASRRLTLFGFYVLTRMATAIYYLNKILSIGQTNSFFTAQVNILKINF